MQEMTRLLALSFVISICLWSSETTAQSLDAAMEHVADKEWQAAESAAGRAGVIPADIVLWHKLRSGDGSAKEALDFLKRRSDWPGMPYLMRQSEASMDGASDSAVLAFFDSYEPQSAVGALRYARALMRTGRDADGQAVLLRAWARLPMPAQVQQAYLSRHATLLRPHHEARLSRLLWEGHDVSAGRMLPLVGSGPRKLAEARIALIKRQSNGVNALIDAIPASYRNDPGLAYDRFAWRDTKGYRDGALEMMQSRSTSAKALGEPGKWLRRRRDFARQLMRDGKNLDAYTLAANHFSSPEDGYGFADCEWIAGYIALRKLNNPEQAVYHFTRFLSAVETPVSVGRAGYWLGRAYGELGEVEKAHAAYRLGAKYQTSFYGLLAAEALGREFDTQLRNPPSVSWKNAPFLKTSVAQAGLALMNAGKPVLAERFMTHLSESLSPDEALQLAHMAVDKGDPHLAVMISKRAAQQGLELPGAYYPLHPVAAKKLPMAPEMTLAIARRESEFDPTVISHAGARGLMQVMPKTAQQVASIIDLGGHTTARLTSDWQHNAVLGANYLAQLAKEFDGNVVLMAAGYNAGPHRPISWMKRYDDPRKSSVNVIDWIEHIPFNETRNYVMRVTESLPVYRARLGKPPLPVPFSQELAGRTLHMFAPKGE